mmetsp:Transcript_15798/g.15760  ORF Transcript_15798/g.15760 Transcript_15798/m.15760 type:complete len:91 (-) Transcript_15798:165-437(-)
MVESEFENKTYATAEPSPLEYINVTFRSDVRTNNHQYQYQYHRYRHRRHIFLKIQRAMVCMSLLLVSMPSISSDPAGVCALMIYAKSFYL